MLGEEREKKRKEGESGGWEIKVEGSLEGKGLFARERAEFALLCFAAINCRSWGIGVHINIWLYYYDLYKLGQEVLLISIWGLNWYNYFLGV